MQNKFDAIVVGTGISGGWAAKELTEKGLKTLVLERGRMVRHIEDYPTMNMHPWEFEGGITKTQKIYKDHPKQTRTGQITEHSKHFFCLGFGFLALFLGSRGPIPSPNGPLGASF